MQSLTLNPIGFIRSQIFNRESAPKFTIYDQGYLGSIEILPEFEEGLDGIERYEWIDIIFWFNKADPASLKVLPPRATEQRGLFATRAPNRINPIGLSTVKLIGREGNILLVDGVDMFDQTPVIDIKPHKSVFMKP